MRCWAQRLMIRVDRAQSASAISHGPASHHVSSPFLLFRCMGSHATVVATLLAWWKRQLLLLKQGRTKCLDADLCFLSVPTILIQTSSGSVTPSSYPSPSSFPSTASSFVRERRSILQVRAPHAARARAQLQRRAHPLAEVLSVGVGHACQPRVQGVFHVRVPA